MHCNHKHMLQMFSCFVSFAHVAAVYLLQSTVFPNA